MTHSDKVTKSGTVSDRAYVTALRVADSGIIPLPFSRDISMFDTFLPEPSDRKSLLQLRRGCSNPPIGDYLPIPARPAPWVTEREVTSGSASPRYIAPPDHVLRVHAWTGPDLLQLAEERAAAGCIRVSAGLTIVTPRWIDAARTIANLTALVTKDAEEDRDMAACPAYIQDAVMYSLESLVHQLSQRSGRVEVDYSEPRITWEAGLGWEAVSGQCPGLELCREIQHALHYDGYGEGFTCRIDLAQGESDTWEIVECIPGDAIEPFDVADGAVATRLVFAAGRPSQNARSYDQAAPQRSTDIPAGVLVVVVPVTLNAAAVSSASNRSIAAYSGSLQGDPGSPDLPDVYGQLADATLSRAEKLPVGSSGEALAYVLAEAYNTLSYQDATAPEMRSIRFVQGVTDNASCWAVT